jgi:uncharacterized protein (DUF2345 family)
MATYDHYTGDLASNIKYTSGSPTVEYPAKDIVNVFGPIYTPRIYGSELTALEIASSGNVTIALNDVHAIDLWNAGNVTYLQSLSNNSLKLVAGPLSNATFGLSTSNYDVSTYSEHDINFSALNNVESTTFKTTNFVAHNNFVATADSNVTLRATAEKLSLYAHSDAVSLVFDNTTDNATLTAAKNVALVAENNFTTVARSNVTITATHQSLDLSAHSGAVTLNFNDVTDNATLTAVKNVALVAENDFTTVARSNVTLTATNKSLGLHAHSDAMSLVFNDTTDNATLTTAKDTVLRSYNDTSVTAQSNVTIEGLAKSVFLKAHNQAVKLTLDDPTDSIIGLAVGNVTFNAGDKVTAAASNAVAVSSATSTVTTTAATNIVSDAGGSILSGASNNVTVTAVTGTLTNQATGAGVVVSAGTTVGTTAGTGITSTATTGNITSTAAVGNYNVNAGGNLVEHVNGSVTVASSNNIGLTAVNGTGSFDAKTGLSFSTSNSTNYMFMKMDDTTGAITISAPNGVSIAGGSGESVQNTQTSYKFNVQGNQIVGIDNNGLQVSGILDTINIHETELWVQDKLLYLAVESNNQWVQDGLANNGGGIRINGNPYGAASNDNLPFLKSILWNQSTNGVLDLGKSHTAGLESYWEIKGGHLRLTHTKNDSGKYISYCWRINDLDELEFVKISATTAAGTKTIRTVAKFGNTGSVI